MSSTKPQTGQHRRAAILAGQAQEKLTRELITPEGAALQLKLASGG